MTFYKHPSCCRAWQHLVNNYFYTVFFSQNIYIFVQSNSLLVLQVTAAAWLSSNFYLKIASFTYSIINTKSFSYFTEIKNYNKLTHGIKYLNVFQCKLLSLSSIPKEVILVHSLFSGVHEFHQRACPLVGVASTLDIPFAGDFSLTFIGRPLPGAGQPSALCPSKSFLLSETNKQNKTNPPTGKQRRKKRKKRKKKSAGHP